MWQINTDTNPDYTSIIGSPVIGTNGMIYIAANGWLKAINSTNRLAPLAKSPWPMFRADPRHTGRVEMEKSN